MEKLYRFFMKNKKIINIMLISMLVMLLILPIATKKYVYRDHQYYDKENVARYIKKYHELPKNYVTKDYKNFLENHSEFDKEKELKGKIIGGDTHYNNHDLTKYKVPNNVKLAECDFHTSTFSYSILDKNRGKYRLVYTTNVDNPKVFETDDHYETFVELTDFNLQITSNVFWILFSIYLCGVIVFYLLIYYKKKNAE